MSFNFVVENLNTSIGRLVNWYREFMRRTEHAFRAMNRRILALEQREARPTDEQVERALRKIFADKFADPGLQKMKISNVMKEGEYFVGDPNADGVIPYAIEMDPDTLQVDPDGYPSEKYRETLEMLEGKVNQFPDLDSSNPGEDDDEAPTAQRARPSPPRSDHLKSPAHN